MSTHLTDAERETLLAAVMDWEDHGGEMPTYILSAVEAIIAAHEAEALLSRAELADEAQRLRNHLSGLERISKAVGRVTPCSCSAQRARADQAEAERDRLAATVERVEALADEWETAHGNPPIDPSHISVRHARRLRSALSNAGRGK